MTPAQTAWVSARNDVLRCFASRSPLTTHGTTRQHLHPLTLLLIFKVQNIRVDILEIPLLNASRHALGVLIRGFFLGGLRPQGRNAGHKVQNAKFGTLRCTFGALGPVFTIHVLDPKKTWVRGKGPETDGTIAAACGASSWGRTVLLKIQSKCRYQH